MAFGRHLAVWANYWEVYILEMEHNIHSWIYSFIYWITCLLINSTNAEFLGAGDLRMNRALFLPSEY